MQNDTIGRLRMNISASSGLAETLLPACSRLYHQRLRSDLRTLLSRLDPGTSVYLERIELDLGNLPLAHWEQTLGERLLIALEQALVAQLPMALSCDATGRQTEQHLQVQNDATLLAAGQWPKLDGFTASVTSHLPQLPPVEVADFSMLRNYLHSGFAEVALRTRLQEGISMAWWWQQFQITPQRWATLLEGCHHHPAAWQRLLGSLGGGQQAYGDAPVHTFYHPVQSGPRTMRQILQNMPSRNYSQHDVAMPDQDSVSLKMLLHYLRSGDVAPALRALFINGGAPDWLRQQLQQRPPLWSALIVQCRRQPQAWRRLYNHFAFPRQLLSTSPVASASLDERSMLTEARVYQVDNAGLVLLWPLLPRLMHCWGLVEAGQFIDAAAQEQAICRLDTWCWQTTAPAEWRMPLTKLLCGWTMEQGLTLSVQDDWNLQAGQDLDTLVQDVIAQTPGMQRCSPDDVRIWFLQRPGQLHHENGRWYLQIERDASDVLLREMPWQVTQVSLPWLESPLTVQWW